MKKVLEKHKRTKTDSQRIDDVVGKLEQIEANVSGNNLPSFLVVPHSLHKRNGCLVHINKKLSQLFSLDKDDAQNATLTDRIHVQDKVVFLHTISNISSFDQEVTIEIRLVEHANCPKWVEVSFIALKQTFENEPMVLATYRDIATRKQSEEALEHAKRAAEEANISKSRFLANTSHELRTPLNAILGFSELLTSPLMAEAAISKRNEYAGLINDSAQHLLSVLNGILDMSKIEAGKYEILTDRFDLGNCLTNTVAIMQGQAHTRQIQLRTEGFDELPEIVADEKAVRQILINLLSNAIKFSDENSLVEIKAYRRARSIVINVSDNGIGISDENLKHLGKPFFQADSKYDRKYEGTGLGLSVVRGLVELHEGEVCFDSKRGKGTTVTVSLPIHGKPGRRQPAGETTEKVTEIRKCDDRADFSLARNAS